MTTKGRPPASDTHQELIEPLEGIALQVHDWLHAEPLRDSDSPWQDLQLALIVRALNQYRAILNLLKTNHWEDALILTRSLFELALNAEELCDRQKDKAEAARLFFLFSELQDFLEWLELQRYLVATKRRPEGDSAKLDQAEASARKVFAPFSYVDKKKRHRWRVHWANRTVADLCNLSKHPIRMHQYKLLYGKGSAFTHSSPAAVFAAMQTGVNTLAEFAAASDATEEKNLKMVASFATIFFTEVLGCVGDRLPRYDAGSLASALDKAVRPLA